MLDDAESELDVLAQSGVLPGARGFGDALDAVRAALASLVGTRGPAYDVPHPRLTPRDA
jgi:hypothetical protein